MAPAHARVCLKAPNALRVLRFTHGRGYDRHAYKDVRKASPFRTRIGRAFRLHSSDVLHILTTFVVGECYAMPSGRFVSYLRVSTARQGKSGLGLEAQRAAVADYLNGGQWELLSEFVEHESGKNADRPHLQAAMQLCRLTSATLVIAKLDRLSRDAAFLMGLERAGIDFVACDLPNANRLTIGILACVAEEERRAISARTKAALAAAKARGTVLGGYKGGPVVNGALGVQARQEKAAAYAKEVRPVVREMRDAGKSLRSIADELQARRVKTPRGGRWTAKAVMGLLAA